MLTATTLQIHLLNFTEANKLVTQRLAKTDTDKFYFEAQFCGLIDCNNRFLLVYKDATVILPQINDIKNPELKFELSIMQELANALQVSSNNKSDLSQKYIELQKTGQTQNLKQFMAEYFNSTPAIAKKTQWLLDYVNQNPKKYILE